MSNEKYRENPERHLTLDEQVKLARELSEAIDRRNALTGQYPNLDDLTVFINSSPENRSQFDALEQAANEARERFDKSVTDKDSLVTYLHEESDESLANRIAVMFGLKKR